MDDLPPGGAIILILATLPPGALSFGTLFVVSGGSTFSTFSFTALLLLVLFTGAGANIDESFRFLWFWLTGVSGAGGSLENTLMFVLPPGGAVTFVAGFFILLMPWIQLLFIFVDMIICIM